MSKLPADLSGQELRKALQRIGFVLVRQRGSHMIFRRQVPKARVIVPDHKAIRPGTLSQILKAADLTVEALLELLQLPSNHQLPSPTPGFRNKPPPSGVILQGAGQIL